MMEIDELKNKWNLLDESLRKHKSVEEKLIKKMMQEKTDKSLSRLINYSIFGIIIYVGVIGLLSYYLYSIHTGINPRYEDSSLFLQVMLGVFIVLMLVIGGLGTRNLLLLLKINITNTIKNNIEYIQHYNIRHKRLFLRSYIVFTVLFLILLIGIQLTITLPLASWIAILFLTIAGAIYSVWEYKRLFNKNIAIIHNSLNELKELEEEE